MSRIIDWHNHWLAPRVVEAFTKRNQVPRITRSDQGEQVFTGGVLPPLTLATGFTSVKERLVRFNLYFRPSKPDRSGKRVWIISLPPNV